MDWKRRNKSITGQAFEVNLNKLKIREQELEKREKIISNREKILSKWNVPPPANVEIGKCIIIFVRGKVSKAFLGKMEIDHVKVPELKKSWLLSPNKEDLNTVFMGYKTGRFKKEMLPVYIAFEGKETVFPIDELCIEPSEEDDGERLKFFINGRFDNDMLDLMLDKNVTNSVFRPKHDWVLTMTVTLIVAINEYSLLRGDKASPKEQLLGMVIFTVLLGFLVWWNSRSN